MFFGWWIVGAAFFIAMYVGGAIFYGFTAIFEPVANEMGWSYTQISLASSLRGVETGLLAPLIGILVDRLGPRKLIFGGGIISAAGLFLLSRTTSLGMFYTAFFLIALGMSSCAMTVLMTAISNWFHKNVGLASGIAVSGFGFGGILLPLIVKLIEMYDWRTTIAILALGMLITIPSLSLLFRHKPEQYGYLPDGKQANEVTSDTSPSVAQPVEADIKAKQAFKSSTFWHLALAFTCQTTVVHATITHVMPYLSSIGIARSRSGLVATAIPLMSIIGRLSFGRLGDKLDKKLVTAGGFIMIGLGILCFGYAANAGVWLLIAFLVLYGIGYGGCTALRPSLIREYFGRTNFGTVFGLLMGMNMMGGIIGPPLAGWVYDSWGNYQGIWFAFTLLPVVAMASILTTTPVMTGEETTS